MFIILFLYLIFCNKAYSADLKVLIYYETLCPDSIRFYTKQFYPSFQYLKDYIDVDLVPFGKATYTNSSGHLEFQCQHGPVECYGNKIHSCIINNYSTSPSVQFVFCALNSFTPDSNDSIQKCAHQNGIPWNFIEECLSSGKADQLLVENGEKTKSVRPPIEYIPTITFNEYYNKTIENEVQSQFLKLVCNILNNKPQICKYLDYFVGVTLA